MTRRSLLACSGLVLAQPWSSSLAADTGARKLRGIFPILQTPYTTDDAVDFAALEREVDFLDRCGVHGVVWPQRASQYQHLSFQERIEGAERVVAAAKRKRPAVVIGVQASDAATAVKYAKHASRIKPDAIIALPTSDRGEFDLNAIASYFVTIASACDLPLFVQTTGNMSVDFMIKLARQIPTLQFVKDEAGDPVRRLEEFHQHAGPRVFTGNHGRTLIDEMIRGVAGNMPASAWAELYVKAWDNWNLGKHALAFDAFSKAMLFVTEATEYGFPALHYVLHLRGIFPNAKTRGTEFPPLDDRAKEALRATHEFVKPHLIATA